MSRLFGAVLLALLLGSNSQTPCSSTATMTGGISGYCAFVGPQSPSTAQRVGCCNGTATYPSVTNLAGCSLKCQSTYWAFWCSVQCLDNSQKFCKSSFDTLISDCSGCPILNGAVTSDQFFQGQGYQVSTAAPCADFNQNKATSTQAPTFLSARATATSIAAGNTFTVQANVTSGMIMSSSVDVFTPLGNYANTLSGVASLVDYTTNNWRIVFTGTVGTYGPNGLWTLRNLIVSNDNSSTTVSSTVASFNVTGSSALPTATALTICDAAQTPATTQAVQDAFDFVPPQTVNITICTAATNKSVTLAASSPSSCVTVPVLSTNTQYVDLSSISVCATQWTSAALIQLGLSGASVFQFTTVTDTPQQLKFIGRDPTSAVVVLGTVSLLRGFSSTARLIVNGTLTVASTLQQQGAFTLNGGLVLGTPATFSGSQTLINGPITDDGSGKGAITVTAGTAVLPYFTPVKTIAVPVTISGAGTLQSCSSAAGTVTIGLGGTLVVSGCNDTGCTCTRDSAGNSIAATVTSLLVQNGGTIKLSNVGSSAFGLLAGSIALQSGSTIQLSLASSVPSTNFSYALLKVGSCANALVTNVIVTPTLSNRVVTQACDSATGLFYLQVGAVSSTQDTISNSTNSTGIAYAFSTPTSTRITLALDCTSLNATQVVNYIVSNGVTGYGNLAAAQITVVAITCGSVNIDIKCSSTSSVVDATNLCNQIKADAQNPSTRLGAALAGTQTSSSSSDSALYGLFGLVVIPFILVGACYLIFTSRRREADNQYMQDTATFSNVAAAPQPLGRSQQWEQMFAYPPPQQYGFKQPQY